MEAIVGVLAEERLQPQPLEVDLDLCCDLTAAGVHDALEDTIDYARVCDRVVAVLQESRPLLLERLASLVAEEVLAIDPRIDGVEVALRKLRPPVPHPLAGAGVRIVRRNRRGDGGG